MTSPHHLHARAALWSLTDAWPRLLTAEAASAAAEADSGDLGTLQAWRPGSGVHGAQSGDALLDAVIRHSSPGALNPYAERRRRTEETLIWVAQTVIGETVRAGADALARLLRHLPRTLQDAALHLGRWVDEQDQAVRRALGDGDDRQGVPVVACPHCGTKAALAARTSAPPPERVVVCTAGCTCAGPGCGCGMGIEILGARHIWSTAELERALRAQLEQALRRR